MIPFVDLKTQYQSLKDEIQPAVNHIFENAAFIGGPAVAGFEKNFAAFHNLPYCVGASSGTDALIIALKMLGIGPGDEVILPANTFIATAEAVTLVGATPVFADVNPDDYNLCAESFATAITSKTKAVMPVHLFGQPARMTEIMEVADKHNLKVVEDAAQAHGAKIGDTSVGSWGVASCFSFYPGKNLGAYGDGGAVLTGDEKLAAHMRSFLDHGRASHTAHQFVGTNARLDAVQAAILDIKLKHLPSWNEGRRHNAETYNKCFADSKVADLITTPFCRPEASHVYHLYVIQTDKRDELRAFLGENGVQSGIHYPNAVPFTDAYKNMGYKPEDVPVSHKLQGRILSLPMFPELTADQIGQVVETIEKFFV